MKELIELLKNGVIFAPTHHFHIVDEEATNALLLEAATKLEELSRKREPLSVERIYQIHRINQFNDPITFTKLIEKAHGIGVSDE